MPTIDPGRTVALLRELVRIPSENPPGDEQRVARHLAQELASAGLDPVLTEVLPGRPNLTVTLGSGGPPHLWLNAHMDTVPAGDRHAWRHEPFAAEMLDGRVYGRGVVDDKGGVAAMASALRAVASADRGLRGTVTFTAVMGEEAGNLGTRHLLQAGFEADMAVVGEYSSARRIAAGYRGCVWLALTTRGKAAHGSRPHEGVNAVDHMTDQVLPAIRRLELDHEPAPAFVVSQPTLSVNTISGGSLVNVVPEACRAELDIRLVPGQSVATVLQAVEEVLAQARSRESALSVSLEVLQASEPFWTDETSRLVGSLRRSIERVTGAQAGVFGKSGTSDANVIHAALGIPVVAYGPGNSSGHGPDEYLEVDDLLEATSVLAGLVTDVCG